MRRLLSFRVPALYGMALLLAGCGQAPMTTPTAFQQWNALDGTFRIEYPDDWEADGGGRHGIQWAKFKKGSALIDVSVSFSESVVGDILGAGSGSQATMLRKDESGNLVREGEENPPVAILHEAKREDFEKLYSNYQEKEAVAIRPPLGEGRKSEFSGSKGFSQVHGYRVSILNSNRGVTVVCYCADKDWEKLQAAFDKIIDTISRGTPTR